MLNVIGIVLTLLFFSSSALAKEPIFIKVSDAPPGLSVHKKLKSHRFGDHKFGYAEIMSKARSSVDYVHILFSDGSKNDNTFSATIVCFDKNGRQLEALPIKEHMGASIKTMEHNLFFVTNCYSPNKIGVKWEKATTNVDYGAIRDTLIEVVKYYTANPG
ncbi:TPA: hypothetical protein NJ279_004564 [Vibrio parahaemolyticus]|nr:hypothetical protein [Vibrio parahaemolyticus]